MRYAYFQTCNRRERMEHLSVIYFSELRFHPGRQLLGGKTSVKWRNSSSYTARHIIQSPRLMQRSPTTHPEPEITGRRTMSLPSTTTFRLLADFEVEAHWGNQSCMVATCLCSTQIHRHVPRLMKAISLKDGEAWETRVFQYDRRKIFLWYPLKLQKLFMQECNSVST